MSAHGDDPDLLEELFRSTRRVALEHFHGTVEGLDAHDKGGAAGYDPVTVADREIEALLRAGLSSAHPRDRVVGEENGVTGPEDARRTWFVDPIDGTKAFVTGMTGWGTLVGLVEDGRAVAGWMDQPVLRETYAGVDGRATLSRDGVHSSLQTSSCTRVEDAVLYTTHPVMFGEGELRERYDGLGRAVRLQRFGGDCYAYCQLAAGRVDLVVESDLKPYDIVALVPVVEAAGGVVTGPDGRQPLDGGTVVAAATPELAERAWELLGR